MLLEPGRKGGGRDERARPVAAIYDPELTLGLPLDATVGTSMNALAHCAEAYYHPASTEIAARNADTGATAISYALPIVAERLDGIYGRTRLLEGAFRAALALAESGLCLGHAMAQALGGRYGLPQGTTNAICLPAALRFNAEAVPDAVARFARALGADDPVARVEELASVTSPVTSSMSAGRSRRARSTSRTIARTRDPAATSFFATALPMRPVAPVTSVMSSPIGRLSVIVRHFRRLCRL